MSGAVILYGAAGRPLRTAGRLSFWQNCFVAVHTLLVKGEFFRIPLMIKDPGRMFSLVLQSVDPQRIYTPSDLTHHDHIRDGIEFGRHGAPVAFWVADPENGFIHYDLGSSSFTRVPARAGHRPGAIHTFVARTEEQNRGVSVLAPAMKFFKDLNDYLDFELVGAIIASSFPVFIESSDPVGAAAGFPNSEKAGTGQVRYQEVEPGGILYGDLNENPHVLKNDRAGMNNIKPVFPAVLSLKDQHFLLPARG